MFNRFRNALREKARTTDSPWLEKYRRFQRRITGCTLADLGRGNVVKIGPSDVRNLRVEIYGNENSIEIEPGARVFDCRVHMQGDGTRLIIRKNNNLDGCLFWLMGLQSRIEVGEACAISKTNIYASDSGSKVTFGSDCMIASQCEIRCGDGHTLFETDTGEIINKASQITIGEHVWLATNAWVLKDVEIGSGSVVAAKAVVTKDIPRNSLAAGIPAKVIRGNVSWRPEPIHLLPPEWFRQPKAR